MHLTHDPAAAPAPQINFDQFLAVDIRVGTITAVEPFPEARKPALKLTIDFGAGVGTKRSSAQITEHYKAETLIGRQVAAVVKLPAAADRQVHVGSAHPRLPRRGRQCRAVQARYRRAERRPPVLT